MRQIIALAAIALAAASASAAESLKLTVSGLVCQSCADDIEKALSAMDAAKAVLVDIRRKLVAVEAKEGRTLDRQAITAVVVNNGVHVVKIESVPHSVAEIKAQAQGRK